MSWIRWVGSASAVILLAGCSSTSPHVVSQSIETVPGINVVQRDQGNVIGSISLRRSATRVDRQAVSGCLHQFVLPAADIVQPDADTWQSAGEQQIDGVAIHYRLSLQRLKNQNYFLFDQLGQVANTSRSSAVWIPLPAWGQRQPKVVYSALVEQANAIQHCLMQSEDQQRHAAPRRDARTRAS